MFERTAETPWCAVPLLNPEKPTLWFASDLDAHAEVDGQGYDIQYRPRKRRVTKKKSIALTEK